MKRNDAKPKNWSKTVEINSSLQQNFQGILSRAPQMQPVFQIIQSAAKTEVTVLVRGESGTGKELVAHAIHTLSSRRKKPFVA
ncbi:MAG: sigma 54-interacting transcriptional regulator, partial [Methylococcales bacterium]|nr:sigma 54-interacting transcriptional regulator [Methylococcales bacterium]